MTRSGARELAIHFIFDIEFTHDEPENVLDERLNKDYYSTLSDVSDVYTDYPSKSQMDYVRAATIGVTENKAALDEIIEKYSIGWKIGRISRLTRIILELAIFEIKNFEDVPTSVAVNEAVNMTKKYDSNESASFVNGVLGSFIRGEVSE